MINRNNREEIIQQYIQGTLSVQDQQEFEALLKKDTTLRSDVAMQQEIEDSIQEALDVQEIEDLFDTIANEQQGFMQQTSKQVYKKHQRNNGWKNFLWVLVLGGSLISGGIWLAQKQRKDAGTSENKNKLTSSLMQPRKTTPSVKVKKEEVLTPSAHTPQKQGLKEEKTPPKGKKDSTAILKTAPPVALLPLKAELDSLPEITVNQGMGFGKKAEKSTRFRPVYFYNRLPDAQQMHTQTYYQFRDTLRIYGPVSQRKQWYLVFKPHLGEFYLLSPQDTISLAYKEKKIFSLK